MATSNLCLHKGARTVDRFALACVETPQPTDTWFPVPHMDVLGSVEKTLLEAGYGIVSERHGLTRDGARYFGTLDLRSPVADGVTLAVGVRNSLDKSFPLGFCAGNRVFVCDNLAFSSELLVKRKHTRHGETRYREAISLAVRDLGSFQLAEAARVETLRSTPCRPFEAEALLIAAYERGILSARTLPEAIRQYREPQFDWGDRDRLWHVFNAITTPLQARATSNPQQFSAATMGLMSLLAPSAGLDAPIIDVTPTDDEPSTN